jgi:hypothetical protein
LTRPTDSATFAFHAVHFRARIQRGA